MQCFHDINSMKYKLMLILEIFLLLSSGGKIS